MRYKMTDNPLVYVLKPLLNVIRAMRVATLWGGFRRPFGAILQSDEWRVHFVGKQLSKL